MQKVHEIKGGQKNCERIRFCVKLQFFWGGFSVKMYLQFDEYFENLVFLKNTIFRKKKCQKFANNLRNRRRLKKPQNLKFSIKLGKNDKCRKFAKSS